jgi:hypothetical protein
MARRPSVAEGNPVQQSGMAEPEKGDGGEAE